MQYNDMRNLMLNTIENLGKLQVELSSEHVLINTKHAELEVLDKKKAKILSDLRSLESEIELKKQMAKKIEETARESANDIMSYAHARNSESMKRLDEVKKLVQDADLKRRVKELAVPVE